MTNSTTKMAILQTANRVLTGCNSIEKIGEEAIRLGSKALIVTDQNIVKSNVIDRIKSILNCQNFDFSIFDEVTPEPHIELIDKGLNQLKLEKADVIFGIGGGSPMDVAKGISVAATNPKSIEKYLGADLVDNEPLPTILVPTTSGTGSEATKYAIFTYNDMKQGIIDQKIYANVSIIDPTLTTTMPSNVTASTGMDALCHVIECYTSLAATPISDLIAREGLRLIARSLRCAVYNGNDIEARSDMSLGSFYGGLCLTNASVTAVHALSFPLGADYHIPHGIANAIMLPYIIRYNCLTSIERFYEISNILDENTKSMSLRDGALNVFNSIITLLKDINLPTKLKDVDVPKEAIPSMADRALSVQRLLTMNPRTIGKNDIIKLYEEAYE
ncbi:MAG: iron-containing alcohol dehydrogenase [Desulfovermiculus sp.]|nr:iron-containing alcohol dehydrogenase [Desulfovermiculus sp.]